MNHHCHSICSVPGGIHCQATYFIVALCGFLTVTTWHLVQQIWTTIPNTANYKMCSHTQNSQILLIANMSTEWLHTTHLLWTGRWGLQSSFLRVLHKALCYPVWSCWKMDHKDTTCRSYRPVHAFTKTTSSAHFSPLSNSLCRNKGMWLLLWRCNVMQPTHC